MVTGESSSAGIWYAGFWLRLWAALLDGFLYILLMVGVWKLWFAFHPGGEALPMWLGFLLGWVAPPVGTVLFWRVLSGTPGKILVSTRIVRAKDERSPGVARLLLRYLAYPISAVPLCAGFFWVAIDPRKQGWHDKIAGTIVVRDGAPLMGARGYLGLAAGVLALLFVHYRGTHKNADIGAMLSDYGQKVEETFPINRSTLERLRTNPSAALDTFLARGALTIVAPAPAEPEGAEISLKDASRYVGQALEITTRDGETFRAVLKGVRKGSLLLEQRLGTGAMTARLEHSQVVSLKVVQSLETE